MSKSVLTDEAKQDFADIFSYLRNEAGARAAFRVGYEDTSHFSREYKRLFGAPPMRDVERLRAEAGVGL